MRMRKSGVMQDVGVAAGGEAGLDRAVIESHHEAGRIAGRDAGVGGELDGGGGADAQRAAMRQQDLGGGGSGSDGAAGGDDGLAAGDLECSSDGCAAARGFYRRWERWRWGLARPQ